MQITHRIVLLGAVTAALAAPAAALGASGVTVRVEGKTRTLLNRTVHLHAGSLTKGGAPKGACSTRSAAGALDAATHHRWNGKYYPAYSGYLFDTILGVRYTATAKYYWEFFLDGVSASAGACAVMPRPGDQILFAAVPVSDTADYALVITGAPRHARAGHSFTVKVDYVNAKGKKVGLGAARLSGKDFAATTTSAGGTARITPTASGTLTLGASHGPTKRGKDTYGYVRAAQVTVPVGA